MYWIALLLMITFLFIPVLFGIKVDWWTLILTTVTCFVAAVAGAKWGAEFAFKNDEKLDKKRKTEKELNSIYTFFGHLLSLYNGYDSWASSFKDLENFRIENNFAKIKNMSSHEWGILGFVADESLELYEKVFRLERDTEITIEKTTIYANKETNINHIIAQKQFVGVYAEIIMMLFSFNNYTQKYYEKVLITEEMEKKLNATKDKITNIVKNVISSPLSESDKKFLAKLKRRKKWYISFDNQKMPLIVKEWENMFISNDS